MDMKFLDVLLPMMFDGLKLTILIAVVGIGIGFLVGSLCGYLLQSKYKIGKAIAEVYIWIIRATPLMVQALYGYFVIPKLMGVDISSTVVGIGVIALNSGAFISEIVKGALMGIDSGQKEAGASLGLTSSQTMLHLVIPPAFKAALPALFNQFITSVKDTALLSEMCIRDSNITSREQVIVNTWYGGEMKKGMFSMMNYFLPLKGMAAMHCSANTDLNGENTAIFFGLSGTGKTTLSTDPKRLLIGDDEHGWDDNGVFNFEGGCYAKVINLDKESEPDIYNAIKRNALLENVTLDENGKIDFADKSVTENTRVSYLIDHIQNIVRPISSSPAAKNVIFLSADAFGVLPPVSVLTPEPVSYTHLVQAVYKDYGSTFETNDSYDCNYVNIRNITVI